MDYMTNPSSILGVASGLAMAGLGLIVLVVAVRARQRGVARAGTMAFASFALLWGFQITAANMSFMAISKGPVLFWSYANVALLIPMYLPLLVFMARHPAPIHRVANQPLALFLASVPAATMLLLLWTAPHLFVDGTQPHPVDGLPIASFGPLFIPVGLVGTIGVFVLALWAAVARWRQAASPAVRDQMAVVVAALLTYVSYKGTEVFTYGLPGSTLFDVLVLQGDLGLNWVHAAAAMLSVLAVAGIALARPGEPWRGLVVTTAVVPMAAGLLERFVIDMEAVGFNMVGLWRLLTVALFAYGIAHYRLLNIDLRARAATGIITYAALCLATTALLWQWGRDVLVDRPWLGGAALIGIPAMFAPALRFARAGGDGRGPPSDTGRVYRRRLEIYRAALEESRNQNMGPRTDQHYLSVLRRSLNITPDEHRVLLALADQSAPGTDDGLQPGQLVGGRYRVGRAIAEGSHGHIVLASDSLTGQNVVLKQLQNQWRSSAEARKRLEREIHLMRSLDHPHLVKLLDAVRGPTPILVMEHLSDGDLEQRLRKGALPPEACLRVVRDVAAALDSLHASGVVHRDVKPANILFDGDGRAKLGDFGIALALEPEEDWTQLTTQGTQPGTVAYMSPEQARGDRVTAASDQYSLAAVLYRMLTGEPPVSLQGLSDFRARRAIESQRPDFPIHDAPPAISMAVERAMSVAPSDRFASAGAFAEALTDADAEWTRKAPAATRAASPAPTEWA